jgi:hypothetical protein
MQWVHRPEGGKFCRGGINCLGRSGAEATETRVLLGFS